MYDRLRFCQKVLHRFRNAIEGHRDFFPSPWNDGTDSVGDSLQVL